MSFSIVILVILFVVLLRAIIHRTLTHSISHLYGPLPGPWLVGNLPEILRPDNVGEAEFAWTKEYGTALKLKGAFGIDILFTADPKAIQYIFNAGYDFPRAQQSIALSKVFVGPGILSAQGTQHARHRKIMNPAFSYRSLLLFLPIFRHMSQKTVGRWKDSMAQSGGQSMVLDIPTWLARITLDAIGLAAFDHDFGAIEQRGDDELSAVYKNIFMDSFFKRSDFAIAFEALWGYLPLGIVSAIQFLPLKHLKRAGKYKVVARRVARDILKTQTESYYYGKEGGIDVMSMIIRANLAADPKAKLSEKEVIAQLQTLMIAGQETSASTLTWILYELSRHPEIQTRVRAEIGATQAQTARRGDRELTILDYDSMHNLLAVIKETLRYHPIATLLSREAGREDLIPLSAPLVTKTGLVITSIPVRKGQRVIISVGAYNRLPSVWGEDADVWRPERFLEGVESIQKTGVGVIANLATFSGGTRNCIGWRFAMLEMQAILIDLLEEFEFSPAPGNPEIIRSATAVMSPMIKRHTGRAQLPLTITALK